MNDILKLLGKEYSLVIGNYRDGSYFVRVAGSHSKYIQKQIAAEILGEGARIDIVLYTIGQCIAHLNAGEYEGLMVDTGN